MAYNKLTQCVICIEGQKKEDDFSCRQIGKRVFNSFQNQEEEEEGEEEKEERNIFTCDSCHFWEARADGFSGVVPMAWTIMHAKEWTARKEAGLTDFNGSLFFPDGDVNIPKFKEQQMPSDDKSEAKKALFKTKKRKTSLILQSRNPLRHWEGQAN
ncbi:hypothetical protein DAPPUDRAFT_120291 [Daphnia pulex]|uniref:Uncharacterized protein n=1 Tax=Daphnia pulex TaxID=6669 RepID=E9I0V5_DAPPU|nr:hypothetical protein DAPPUDRAFT_120291 [Daphnia pulex]|eukprot:EFX62375.1 hypothetical protein DAPPUDRAFT_120291 [Daphnia pulex]